jgi:hypothetical protein
VPIFLALKVNLVKAGQMYRTPVAISNIQLKLEYAIQIDKLTRN